MFSVCTYKHACTQCHAYIYMYKHNVHVYTSLGLVLNLLRPVLTILCFSFSWRISLWRREREREREGGRGGRIEGGEWDFLTRRAGRQCASLVIGLVQCSQLIVNVYDLTSQLLQCIQQPHTTRITYTVSWDHTIDTIPSSCSAYNNHTQHTSHTQWAEITP